MGGSKSSSKTYTYTPAQKKGGQELLDLYGPELGKGQVSYPGTEVAEFTPTQKAAMSGLDEYLKGFSPDNKTSMFGQTGSALSGILSGQTGAKKITPEETASFFKRGYQEPAMYQFSEYTRPLIREEYAGPGFWGSARAKAVSKAGQELGNWLGQKRGEVEWQAGETNRSIDEAKAGRAAAAVPMGMQYAGQPLRERQGVFGFAAVEQQQRQRMIDESIKKFQEGKRLTDPEIMNILMQMITSQMGSGSSSETGMGALGQFGKGAGFAAGGTLAANMLTPALSTGAGTVAGAGINYMAAVPFSDIRLKENLEPIENALDKVIALDGKTYNFIGKTEKEAGLIAQDLEKVLPESVVKDENGVRLVKPFAVIALLVNAVKELAEQRKT